MQATIFYDDTEASDASARLQAQLLDEPHARSSSSSSPSASTFFSSRNDACPLLPPPQYYYKSFACSGTALIPELKASLMWWLEESNSSTPRTAASAATTGPVVVHMLAVNDREAAAVARSAPTRKLSVQLPVCGMDALLTCGLTRLSRGGHCLSLAWLTTCMQAGCARVTVQRDTDATGGALLLTAEGDVICSPPIRSMLGKAAGSATFQDGNHSKSTGSNGNSGFAANAKGATLLLRNASDNSTVGMTRGDGPLPPSCGPHTSACVLSEIPTVDAAADQWEPYDRFTDNYVRKVNPATSPRNVANAEGASASTATVAAMFAVTDGVSVWRVKLMDSGRTALITLRDNPRKEYVGALCAQLNNPLARSSGKAGWTASREISNLQLVSKRRRMGGSAHSASTPDSTHDASLANAEDQGHGHQDGEVASFEDDSAVVHIARASPHGRTSWLSRLLRSDTAPSGGANGAGSVPASPPPRRRFLCVSAVQGTPYIALVRWCGLIELYDADLTTVEHYPSCYIPSQELAASGSVSSSDASTAAPSATVSTFAPQDGDADAERTTGTGVASAGRVQQWASRSESTNAIHVLTCFGSLEGRRCVWARIPAVDRSAEEKVVLRCTYSIVPPASGSAAMACAVVTTRTVVPAAAAAAATTHATTLNGAAASEETLAVLWDVGVEEEARLLTGSSVRSLLSPARTPVAAALQLLHGRRGAQEAWVWTGTETYLCQSSGGGGLACAVLSAGGADARDLVIIEQQSAGVRHRAYVVRPAPRPVAALAASTRMDSIDGPSDDDDGAAPAYRSYAVGNHTETAVLCCVTNADGDGDALRALQLVPTSDVEAASLVASGSINASGDRHPLSATALAGYREGCEALKGCAHGAGLLRQLLNDALTASFTVHQLLPALSRVLHEVHLSGHCCEEMEESDGDDSGYENGGETEGEYGEEDESYVGAARIQRMVHEAVLATMRVGPVQTPLASRHQSAAAAAAAAASAAPFCSFGRPYIVQTVLQSLLSRLAFLVVTLVGIVARSQAALTASTTATTSAMTIISRSHVPPPQPLVRAIQLVAAAYHSARVAGPELVRLAPASAELPRPYASGDEIARAILSRLLPCPQPAQRHHDPSNPSSHSSAHNTEQLPSLPVFAVSVAAALHRCRTPRAVRASASWAAQLQHHFPVLTHFRLLSDIDAGRTTRSGEQQDMCMKVVRSLASLTSEATCATTPQESSGYRREDSVVRCLMDEGFLVADASGRTAFAALLRQHSDAAGQAEVRAWALQRPSLAPKLYAVGILRRLVPSFGSGGGGGLGNGLPPSSPSSPANSHNAHTALRAQLQQQLQQHQHRAAVSVATVRQYYLTELQQVRVGMSPQLPSDGSVTVASGGYMDTTVARWPRLSQALDGLLLDTWLFLANGAVAEGDIGACWHDLEDALELASCRDVLFRHVEAFHAVLGRVVECVCASHANMDALIATSSTTAAAVALEELLVVKWYNTIARMPTKSASEATEATRYRAIMGLYRYLMVRHAYAQCGRIMSDLASLLRCSPLRRSALYSGTAGAVTAASASAVSEGSGSAISVGELASLALAAVELIAPTPVVQPYGCDSKENANSVEQDSTRRTLHGSPVSRGFAWRAAASPLSPTGEAGGDGCHPHYMTSRLLSREDLPWLRRRVYQAHCERVLWRRGGTLDCTDIWIDGAPYAEVCSGLRRLTLALETAELWPEAYRLATLACDPAAVDPVVVLCHWAVHLTRRARRLQATRDGGRRQGGGYALAVDCEMEDISSQWRAIIAHTGGEQSSLANQFAGYSRVLLVALTTDYEHTAPELRDAHRRADPYTAAGTLLRVFTIMRDRLPGARGRSSDAAAGFDGAEQEMDAAAVEAAVEGEGGLDGGDGISRGELQAHSEALSWLPWAHAAELCTDVLSACAGSAAGATSTAVPLPQGIEVFTAGVVDSLVRHAREAQQVAPDVKRIITQHHAGLELDRVATELVQAVARVRG